MTNNYKFFFKTFAAMCFFVANLVFSQNTSTTLNLDTTYDAGTGFYGNGSVTKQAVQSDGKIIIVGDFNVYGSVGRSKIARINTDGTLDTTFNPGTGFTQPFTIAPVVKIQADGKIIVAGSFSSYNGTSRTNIVRINTDGSIDANFTPGTGTNSNAITSIDVQSDGKILIAGPYLYTYNNSSVNNVARLNTDGTLDTSFVASTFGGSQATPASVKSVKVQSVSGIDKILVGGAIGAYNGISRNNILRLNLDGTLDTSFDAGNSISGNIVGIEINNTTGNLLLLGVTASYNGNTVLGLISTSANGTLDTSFNYLGTGANATPANMAQLSNGKILITGDFSSYNGVTRNGAALIKADGSLDTSFDPGSCTNAPVSSIGISSDGGFLFVGPNITNYNGTNLNSFFKIDATGALDASFNNNAKVLNANQPSCVAKQADDKLLLGGYFNIVNGTSKNNLVRLNTDGSVDTTFNNGGSGPNYQVQSISIQSDGKILIGGSFTNYNGTSSVGIARLNTDGTLDSTFTPGTGFTTNGLPPYVYAIQQLASGKILVGGSQFTTYNGTALANKNLIRLNVDGTYDSTFNNGGVGVNSASQGASINAIKEQADGQILIGGTFTSFNGTNANGFIRLNADGSVDTNFTQTWASGIGINMSGAVRYILIQPSDNKIIIGGTFTSYSGTSRTNYARINTDGTLDTTFNAGTAGAGYLPLLLSDEKLLIPGSFTSFNGTTINRLVRLKTDGTVDTTFTPGSTGAAGAFNPVQTTRLSFAIQQTDGNIVLLGNFNSYNGTSRTVLARVTPVVTTLATSNPTLNKYSLYPNPAKDFVTISNLTKGSDVVLFDITGKLLYQAKSLGTTLTINTSTYKNGMYLVKVDGQTTKLLISK